MSDAPLAYLDDDNVLTIRASALGKCIRALWAATEGIQPMSPSDFLEDIFDEGHLHEKAVRKMLESQGANTDNRAEVTLWILPGKVRIVGHLDGDIENWLQIWENKALGKESFRRFKNVGFDAFEDYAWQISVYMLATNKNALYTVKSRDSGEVMRFILDTPPISEVQIKMKALRLYTAIKDGVMPACDPERWGCPFFFLHDEAEEDEAVELEDPYTESLAGKLLDTRLAIKELQGTEKALKEELLNKIGVGEHVGDVVRVKIRTQTSRRLDQGLMIEAGLNPDDYKKESDPYFVIDVKERE